MLKIVKSITVAVSIAVVITSLTACAVPNPKVAAASASVQLTSNVQETEAPESCRRTFPETPGIYFDMYGADCLVNHTNIEMTR